MPDAGAGEEASRVYSRGLDPRENPGDERIHNTTVAFDREGSEVARYRKIHMFDITAPDGAPYRESASFKPGDAVVTYDCEGVTIGCAICYDVRFPYLFAGARRQGRRTDRAAVGLHAADRQGPLGSFLPRARHRDARPIFARRRRPGRITAGNEVRQTYGHSLVADPWGHVVAKASDGAGVVSARIDPKRVEKVRAMIPVAQHRVKLAE